MKMNNINQIQDLCFGCRSCEQVCPKNSIKFKYDKEGFLYPNIDSKTCIECGLCLKKCPANNLASHRNKPLKFYGVKNKNDSEIMKSASGGVSDLLVQYILQQGGVAFGASYDENLRVHHIVVDDEQSRNQIKSSKYVQSDLEDTYSKTKKYLLKGSIVLFTGTPCQISGLYSYLGKDYDNLYTIDLICHGVPSPIFFKKYIEYQNKKLGENVLSFNFRSKDKRGWGTQYLIKTKTKTKTKTNILSLDKYGNHFMKGDCFRESCYKCPFANMERVGDLTIGDFWGVNNFHLEFFSSKGVSSVLINTDKGEKLLRTIQEKCLMIELIYDEVIYKQHNLVSPTVRTDDRNKIYQQLNEKNYIENLKVGLQFKERIKSIIPKNMIIYIKQLGGKNG